MYTSETAANLPVWTDRELIRIIVNQKGKKNGFPASESSLFLFLFLLLLFEGSVVLVKVLVVSKGLNLAEPYHRGNPSVTHGGSGSGLYVCHVLVI